MEDVRHYGFEVRRLDHVFARNLEAKVREKGIDELTLIDIKLFDIELFYI